ncbi:MAG: hypothetical protein KAU14_00750, partial [Thermoplasmata archaeon]|nr:hypothetical protein [Thermoplasmata archaeon]
RKNEERSSEFRMSHDAQSAEWRLNPKDSISPKESSRRKLAKKKKKATRISGVFEDTGVDKASSKQLADSSKSKRLEIPEPRPITPEPKGFESPGPEQEKKQQQKTG